MLWLNPALSGADAMFYGTYLGGTDVDSGNGIAIDSQGRIAVVGTTKSTDLAAGNGYLSSRLGTQDAFVALIDPLQSGTGTLVYMTYLGGTNWDAGSGIAAAPDGTLWVTGATLSGDFPVAGNAVQPYYGFGGDAFVSQIDPNQAGGSSLLYSSYLGGSDNEQGNAIAVDPGGRVLVTGFTLSTDFLVTGTAAQTRLATADSDMTSANAFVFVMKLANTVNASSQVLYSSYLGGTGGDEGYAIKGDSEGNIYVAGLTKSMDFPVTKDALQSQLQGGPAGFVTKLNPARTALDYSSLVASKGNQSVYSLDVDAQGFVYLAASPAAPCWRRWAARQGPPARGQYRRVRCRIQPVLVIGVAHQPHVRSLRRDRHHYRDGGSWMRVDGGQRRRVDGRLSCPRGTASGQVIVASGPNSTGAVRTGTVAVAGTSIPVSQASQ